MSVSAPHASPSASFHILNLPHELLNLILKESDDNFTDFKRLSSVCKVFMKIIHHMYKLLFQFSMNEHYMKANIYMRPQSNGFNINCNIFLPEKRTSLLRGMQYLESKNFKVPAKITGTRFALSAFCAFADLNHHLSNKTNSMRNMTLINKSKSRSLRLASCLIDDVLHLRAIVVGKNETQIPTVFFNTSSEFTQYCRTKLRQSVR